jgi:formate dehydrogenase major subunit
MITGKMGKTAQGLIGLKEKNNSQGVIDMGGCHKVAPGFRFYEQPEVVESLRKKWGVNDLPTDIKSPYKLLKDHQLKNIFIFGEDPVGCAINRSMVDDWFKNIEFMVVQDYFMTETAQRSDLILPASLPFETGGSFTTTQRRLQKFDKQIESAMEFTSMQQLITLMKNFGLNGISDHEDALNEFFSLLPPPGDDEKQIFHFQFTEHDNFNLTFNHGCDIVNKCFDDEFNRAFAKQDMIVS